MIFVITVAEEFSSATFLKRKLFQTLIKVLGGTSTVKLSGISDISCSSSR